MTTETENDAPDLFGSPLPQSGHAFWGSDPSGYCACQECEPTPLPPEQEQPRRMTPDQASQAVSDQAIVRLYSAHDFADTRAVGQIISYSIVPTVTIVTADGERISWRHDLAEVIASSKPEGGAVNDTAAEHEALASIARRCANPLGIYDEDGYCYWCGNHKGKAGHGYDCPLADALDPTLTPRCPIPPGEEH